MHVEETHLTLYHVIKNYFTRRVVNYKYSANSDHSFVVSDYYYMFTKYIVLHIFLVY